MAQLTPTNLARFVDRVVLITGGSRGIGAGCVRLFHKHGAKVVFCSNAKSEGETLAAELNKDDKERDNSTAPSVIFSFCDVREEEQIKATVDLTLKEFGRLDCLINNAGTHPDHFKIDSFSAEDFRSLFEVNVMSMFIFCKQALPHLRKTHGSIVNISSLTATIGQFRATTYVATKGAINGLTLALAVDEAPNNVRVNALAPGVINTPLLHCNLQVESNQNGTEMSDLLKGCDQQTLLGHMGTPDDVGQACLFLAAEGSYITGVILPVSGGAELDYACKVRTNLQKD